MERATLDSLSVIMEFVLPVLTKMTFVVRLEDGDDIAECEPITHSMIAYNLLRRDVRDFASHRHRVITFCTRQCSLFSRVRPFALSLVRLALAGCVRQ